MEKGEMKLKLALSHKMAESWDIIEIKPLNARNLTARSEKALLFQLEA